jgi:catechol 2,3-dioxygenase-like lactoylglutathione lyase family enzyme
MAPMAQLNAIGIVAADMGESIRFYRLLGLDVPETPDEGHVDTFLPNGVRFMLDSEETMRSFMDGWQRETGNQVGIAFECDSPAEVDEIYARVTEAGFHGDKEPWDAFWGQRYAILKDPSGVDVSLYAPLAQ